MSSFSCSWIIQSNYNYSECTGICGGNSHWIHIHAEIPKHTFITSTPPLARSHQAYKIQTQVKVSNSKRKRIFTKYSVNQTPDLYIVMGASHDCSITMQCGMTLRKWSQAESDHEQRDTIPSELRYELSQNKREHTTN